MSHTISELPPYSVRPTTAIRRRLPWWSALGLCGFCSCASLPQPVASSDPFHSEPAAPAVASALPQAQSTVGRARIESSPLVPAPRPQAAYRVAQPTRRPVAQNIQLASNDVVHASASDAAVERVDAEARTPAVCPDGYGYAEGYVYDDDAASPALFPDEYLFDGGDRAYPITRSPYQIEGLDTEDTIAQFDDDEGRTKIKKTNRVAIYAPRFGSVVMVSGPNSDTLVDKVYGHVVAQGGVNLRNRTVTETQAQNLDTGRMQTRLRANGVGTDIATDSLNRGQGRAVSINVMNTHESLSRLRNGQFDDSLRLTQLQGMQFAEMWTRKQNPVIEGHASSASQSKTVQVLADYTGVEDNGKRGDLLLRKTADKGVAEIGDIVTFTITYENRGDRPLTKVSIIDNLTPRLEYIAESTTTDRPGKVEAEDNGEGSVILRFILDEALPGRTKGSVTFQARVR
ncbi:MAG: conserved repeat domain protein [Planctomycetaceae bacterium]|nr:conserved repeat domain protein [Planctomycetaceae bacterium]